MSIPIPIRHFDSSFQHLRLNFRNQIFHSFVDSFARDEEDSGLSVKMVLAGAGERYRIGDRMHHIMPGRFLVINHHQQFQCRVKSPNPVEGMCFYIDPAAAREVHHFTKSGHRRLLDEQGKAQQSDPVFLEKVFGLSESPLGNFLQAMSPILRDPQKRQGINFDDFFLTMAERLVHSECQTKVFIDSLTNEKPSTREELFRRISLAKCHIDEHCLQDINLDTLAEVAMTSKYHFLRCFKEIYRCSPYQYILQKRLQHGATLLLKGRYSLTEIAMETGFTDRRAFNKAFKKMYGTLPSDFKK